jgi:hypothetical protein
MLNRIISYTLDGFLVFVMGWFVFVRSFPLALRIGLVVALVLRLIWSPVTGFGWHLRIFRDGFELRF